MIEKAARLLLIPTCLLLLGVSAALAQTNNGGGLKMTDLHMSPKTIQVQWNDPPPCSAPTGDGPSDSDTSYGCTTWGMLQRTPGGIGPFYDSNGQPVSGYTHNGSTNIFDDHNWNYNTHYEYYLPVVQYAYAWSHIAHQWSTVTTYSSYSIFVTVRKVLASVNQTADTRLDMRYGDPTLKDYQFKDSKWRGGLFAGYNGDNSKVSRTYFKFTNVLGPTVTGEKLYPFGGIAMYCTRLANTGSVSLQCRRGLSDTWDATTLKWSNAPAPKTSGGPPFPINWDKTNLFGAPGDPYSPPASTDPTGKWIVVNFLPDIQDVLADNTTTLTAIVQSPNEVSSNSVGPDSTTGGGWAYFAKGGYGEPNQPAGESDLTAYLLYAFGGEGVSYDDPGNGGGGGDGGGGWGDGGFEGFSTKKKNPKPGTKSPVPSSQPKAQPQGIKAAVLQGTTLGATPGAKP